MGLKRIMWIGLCLFWLVPAAGRAQKTVNVELTTRGSPPPITGLYDCIRQIDGKPYAEDKARGCLRSILDSKYFEHGKIKISKDGPGKVVVRFILQAKALVLDQVSFEVQEQERSGLQNWLQGNKANPGPGRVYDWEGASSIAAGIQQYFLSRGKMVGISPIVYLDYLRGTARLVFGVIEGPMTYPVPGAPPYASLCDDQVDSLVWTDLDRYVPIPLVRDLVKIHSVLSCFSKEAIESDQISLERTGLFSEAQVSYEGPYGHRQVCLRLRGKPLTVQRAVLRFYGRQAGQPMEEETGDLALKAGEVYTRSKARESQEYLEKHYTRPGWKVEVIEQEKVTPQQELEVVFNILEYKEQQVFINGKKVDLTATR